MLPSPKTFLKWHLLKRKQFSPVYQSAACGKCLPDGFAHQSLVQYTCNMYMFPIDLFKYEVFGRRLTGMNLWLFLHQVASMTLREMGFQPLKLSRVLHHVIAETTSMTQRYVSHVYTITMQWLHRRTKESFFCNSTFISPHLKGKCTLAQYMKKKERNVCEHSGKWMAFWLWSCTSHQKRRFFSNPDSISRWLWFPWDPYIKPRVAKTIIKKSIFTYAIWV